MVIRPSDVEAYREQWKWGALSRAFKFEAEKWFEEFPDKPYKIPSGLAQQFGLTPPTELADYAPAPEIGYEDYQKFLAGEGLQFYWAPTKRPLIELPETMTAIGWDVTDEGLLKSPTGELFTLEEYEQKRQEDILRFQEES